MMYRIRDCSNEVNIDPVFYYYEDVLAYLMKLQDLSNGQVIYRIIKD